MSERATLKAVAVCVVCVVCVCVCVCVCVRARLQEVKRHGEFQMGKRSICSGELRHASVLHAA